MRINFKTPKHVVWVKVNGDLAEGLLTNDLKLVPEEVHPKSDTKPVRGYKRLYCLQRARWVSLYTKNILTVAA